MPKLYFCFFLIVSLDALQAQKNYKLDAIQQPIPDALSALNFDTSKHYTSSQWQKLTNHWQKLAIQAGYFLFDLRVSKRTDSLDYFQIYYGPFFSGITYCESDSIIKTFDADQLNARVEDTLNWYLNNGYPFANIKLKYQSAKDPLVHLTAISGPHVRWGQVYVKPEGIIKPKVLQKMLQIDSEQAFSLKAMDNLKPGNLHQMPFKLVRAPEWAYNDNSADIYFYIETIRVSSATGIIGLQTNPGNQQASLVGELNVQLQNNWQKNEKIQLHWRSIAPQSQQLKTKIQLPFIAGSSYGFKSGLTMYKRDTSFIEVRTNVSLGYQFAHGWQLSTQIDHWLSNTIANQTTNELSSFHSTTYGLSLERQFLDNIVNPRKGMDLVVNYLVGNKKTDQTTFTWRLALQQKFYVPLGKRQVFCWSGQLDHLQAPIIFSNELYRFGGLERMRGFDEDAFFASSIVFSGLEYRYLLEENSYALLFTDWAWSENKINLSQNERLYALGLGLVLGTENGQFKLNYALGAQIGQGLRFNAAKVHLGYISYF